MQSIQQKQNDLSRFFQLLLRKKWLILSCIIGALSPIIYYNKVSLPIYEATTMILCEESTGTIPDVGLTQARLGNTFIVNLIQDLKTWSLANEVAKALPDTVTKTYLKKPIYSDLYKEKILTSIIQKSISAEPIRGSDVVKIKAQANNAKIASIIANAVAEVLKQRNLEARLGEIHNVRKTIEDQLEYFKQKVEQTEQALRDYKEKNKVTSIDKESSEILGRISAAEVEYNRVKTQYNAANKRLEFLQGKLSQERKRLVPSITTTTSPWAQKLKQNLVDLEVQYTTLKVQDYDENHPQMKKLKAQIEETKKNLREETLKIARGEDTIDPLSQIQQNLIEIATLEVEIHTFQAREKALLEVLNSYKNSLKSVPEKELKLGRLMRDKTVADNIYTMLLQKREEAKITEAERIGNIRIIDPARVPHRPIRPRKFLNLILGLIVGCTLGVGLTLFLDSLDTSIKTVEEVEKYTDLAVIGSIPRIKSNTNLVKYDNLKDSENGNISSIASRLIVGREPKSPAAEAFRTLRTNIQFEELGSTIKTILITSANPEEGKSLVTANLALAIAQMDLKTLLVDADLRRPVLHALFKQKMQPGLMDILFSTSTLTREAKHILTKGDYLSDYSESEVMPLEQQDFITDAIKNDNDFETLTKQIIKSTHINNLYLLSCGIIPPNPSEILASKTMKALVATLKNNYDIVLFDLPPIIAVTDAAVLAPATDGIVLVIRSGKNKQNEILRAKSLIEKVKGNLLGAVLNDVGVREGYYSSYYYYDKNKKRKRK